MAARHQARRSHWPGTYVLISLNLLVSFTGSASASSPNHAQGQHPLQPPNAPSNNLARLSELFVAASTWSPSKPSAAEPTAPCCGAACPPQYCNIHLPAQDSITDLAWLYSTATPTPTDDLPETPSGITFPCCHDGCADGACRPSPGVSSERPPRSAKITPGPQPAPGGGGGGGGGDNAIPPGPGFRHPGNGDDLGYDPDDVSAWGCCKGCTGCRYSLKPSDPADITQTMMLMATATATAVAEDAARAAVTGGTGAGSGEDLAPQPNSCVGCAGGRGRCYPCRGEKIVQVLALPVEPLLAKPTSTGVDGGWAGGAGLKIVDAWRKLVGGGRPPVHVPVSHPVHHPAEGGGGGGAAADGAQPGAEDPVFLLGSDFVNGVNGFNQDFVPVVVQGFAGNNDDSLADVGAAKGEFELFTLLATVDVKVRENYISQRLVDSLGREAEVVRSPVETHEGHRRRVVVAVLNGLLDTVQVKGSLEMGIVIGSVTGVGGADSSRLLKGVRWLVFDDKGLANVPDVVLGTKLLGEVGGLRSTDALRKPVEGVVRAVGVGHAIHPLAGGGDGGGGGSGKEGSGGIKVNPGRDEL